VHIPHAHAQRDSRRHLQIRVAARARLVLVRLVEREPHALLEALPNQWLAPAAVGSIAPQMPPRHAVAVEARAHSVARATTAPGVPHK
jgi:hypothetical protein